MQDRYTGDIGDYIKLAILRTLSPGYRLGVAWWLYPDERHNADGKHTKYLKNSSKWRSRDADLFDALNEIVGLGNRCTNAIEHAGILPKAKFSSEQIPNSQNRSDWFSNVMVQLRDCNLIFVDPDNGIEPENAPRRPGKHVTFDELNRMAEPGRCLIVYHHHTRRKGGHSAEIVFCRNRLKTTIRGLSSVDALRARPYSPRAFFLLNAPEQIRMRALSLTKQWDGQIEWFPDTGR